MKFKLKILCPECGGPMVQKVQENYFICAERELHKENLAVYRRLGDEDIVYDIQIIEED